MTVTVADGSPLSWTLLLFRSANAVTVSVPTVSPAYEIVATPTLLVLTVPPSEFAPVTENRTGMLLIDPLGRASVAVIDAVVPMVTVCDDGARSRVGPAEFQSTVTTFES